MRSVALVCPSLCLAVGLTAQTTLTAVYVASTAPGTPPVSSGVPQNHSGPVQLTTAPSGFNGASLGIAYPSVPLGDCVRFSTAVHLLDQVPRSAGTTPAQSGGGIAYGAVEFLLTYHAAPGRTGQLTLLADELTSPSAGATTLVNHTTIDVNWDGTIEATSPSGTVAIPVVIGPSGQLLVKVSIANHATGTGFIYSSTQTDVILGLEPVTVTAFGTGCAGATSTATVAPMVPTTGFSAITLSGSGGFPNMPVVSTFGTQIVGPTLPGGCVLLTDPMILVPFLGDAAGASTHAFDVHATAVGVLRHQFVPIDLASFTFRASNGLEIRCW